jgi:hypothetical protein
MSGEANPVLGGVLPAFQSLQNKWEQYALANGDVASYVNVGMEWLNKYHERAGRTPAYVIAMGTPHPLPFRTTFKFRSTDHMILISTQSPNQDGLHHETMVPNGSGNGDQVDERCGTPCTNILAL